MFGKGRKVGIAVNTFGFVAPWAGYFIVPLVHERDVLARRAGNTDSDYGSIVSLGFIFLTLILLPLGSWYCNRARGRSDVDVITALILVPIIGPAIGVLVLVRLKDEDATAAPPVSDEFKVLFERRSYSDLFSAVGFGILLGVCLLLGGVAYLIRSRIAWPTLGIAARQRRYWSVRLSLQLGRHSLVEASLPS